MLGRPIACAPAMRLRAFSVATMSEPCASNAMLPPVWSPCMCVLTTYLTGRSVTVRNSSIARAFSFANFESTMSTASSDVNTVMLPDAELRII
jgi:hypothetical protein